MAERGKPHALSEALRVRALDTAVDFGLRAQLFAVAGEMDRFARFEHRVRQLVLRMTESPTVAEINFALDELQSWAIGLAPLQEADERQGPG